MLKCYILITVFTCIRLITFAQDSVSDGNKAKQSHEVILPKKNSKPQKKMPVAPDEKLGLEISEVETIKQIDSLIAYKETIAKFEQRVSELEDQNDKLREQNTQLIEKVESFSAMLAEKNKKQLRRTGLSFWSIAKALALLTILIICLVAGVIFIIMKRRKKSKKIVPGPALINQKIVTHPVHRVPTVVPEYQNKGIDSLNKLKETEIDQSVSVLPLKATDIAFSNISPNYLSDKSDKFKWFVVGASAIGRSHISTNKRCQDNHYSEYIGNGWGIAIVSDGAGSAENSHHGSTFVATEAAINKFKNLVLKKGWHKKKSLPDEDEWSKDSAKLFKKIYKDLEDFASQNDYPFASVACTIIVVVFSPNGMLITHIGDGRAGYCDEEGQWKSMLTPHKGEEANHTIFITSNSWLINQELRMSGVRVPESRVIREKPVAFVILTDGCESHSFECSKMDAETNKWVDPNIPFPRFFNPIMDNLKSMALNNLSIEEANEKWKIFIEKGTLGIKEESDDKTMIVGVQV